MSQNPDFPSQPERLPWLRRDWLLLLLITLLGAALRLYQLGVVPPGFQFDEAFNAIDALQVLEGNRPLFLPANGGREVLYTYFQAGLVTLLGSSVTVFRLASALWGTAAVAATFVLFRRLLARDSRLVASLGALAMAISYWHIHFSHYGIRVITMPVLLSAVFGLFWAATQAATARRRVLYYLFSGTLAGLSVYSNPTGRFTPFVLAAFVAVILWRTPPARRFAPASPLGGLLLAGLAALVVFLPLGITFLRNPEFFFGHASEVSVFAERVTGGRSPLQLLAVNVLHVLGMFTFFGDVEWTHGIAGRPVLDWVIGVPFYMGVVVWAMRLFGRNRRSDPDANALWLLLIWAAVLLAPSVLSEAAPNYSRTLPSLPATLLPVGLGLAWLVRLEWPRRWMGYTLAGALLATSLVITVRDYFVRYPQMREVYYAYDVDKLDALEILRGRQQTAQVYFSPLWAEHTPVRFMRSGSGIKTLDTADTLVLPAAGGAVFAFTGEEGARAKQFAGLWPGQQVEVIRDKYDKPLLHIVSLDPEKASTWPAGYAPQEEMSAAFDDAPTLLGMQASDGGVVTLFWRSETPTRRSLTSFVHLIDVDGVRLAQADKLPGNSTYPTYLWSPGERVMDRSYPELLDPCAGGESVRAVAGWYEYEANGARRTRVGAPGDSALAGSMTLPVRPLSGEALPPVVLDSAMGDITLLGYALRGNEALQPGSPFAVDLYVRANADMHALPAQLLFGDETGEAAFGETLLAPTQTIEAGESFCQRLRLRVPRQDAAGDAQVDWDPANITLLLRVESAGVEQMSAPIGPLSLVENSRIFTSTATGPALAEFGGALALSAAGADLEGEQSVTVSLAWQALDTPRYRLLAFVHVLSPDGQVVAQSDLPPGGLPANHRLPGEFFDDKRTLPLPAGLAPGTYRVIAGLYDELSLARLAALDGTGARLPDDVIEIARFVLPGDGAAMVAMK